MILSFAELSDAKKFVCPWHRAGGGPCGQSLSEASVLVSVPGRRFAAVKDVIELADGGERQVFWCPSCEGAIYLVAVEQGFKVGIPTP